MPWPATHILIAQKLYKNYFNHLDYQTFILGTSFPDIRYPAKINRKQTHFEKIPINEIQSQTAFMAGLSLHSFVDHLWNAYIRKEQTPLFAEVPHDKPMLHTMKILQDSYLYHQSMQWAAVTQFFKQTLPEELAFGVNQELVARWHMVLAYYLSKPPNIQDIKMLHLSMPPDVVAKITDYYQRYQFNTQLIKCMTGFYNQVENLIKDL